MRSREMRRGGLRGFVAAIVAVGTMAAAAASAAAAAPVAIPGNPMTVYVGPQGQLQAYLAGVPEGVYFTEVPQFGDAGFFLALPEKEKVWGFDGSAGPIGVEPFVPIAQNPVTGSGSAADPFSQVTEYTATEAAPNEGVRVTETTTYVNGATQFVNKWEVTNESGAPVTFRAFAAADFYFEGDDRGTGVFTQGPPRFIGGTNVDSGRSGGFVEVDDGVSPPWSHYQELPFPDIWMNVIERAAIPIPAGFDDTVDAEDVDNAGGVEWDQHQTVPLMPAESAVFEVISRVGIPAALRLDPTNAGAPQGVPIATTATSLDSNGKPYAGQTLRYSIAGANPGSGAIALNAYGQASITDPGTLAGDDTITAFVDFNGDGVREAAEPQASALATFVDNIAPTCKVKVKGDRPGGGGGAGNKLVITVNCDDVAQVKVVGSLILPRLVAHRRHRPPRHAEPHRPGPAAMGARAATNKKGKKHRKPHRRRKPRKVKLPLVTQTVQPGAGVPVRIKVPKKIARRYAGRKLTAKIVATVSDSAGNVSRATSRRRIRLAKPKKPRHHGRGKGKHGKKTHRKGTRRDVR